MKTIFKALILNTFAIISKYLYSPRLVWMSCYTVSLVSRMSLVAINLLINVRSWASDYVQRRCQNVRFQTFLINKYPDIWDNIKSSIKDKTAPKNDKK